MKILTREGVDFIWTKVFQQSFQSLKQKLLEEPILVYPDPNEPNVLFTDVSKYASSCVLIQETQTCNRNQHNWACLTKGAFAIYMSVKKLAYYLEDVDVLRSDHLPLRKCLERNMLNLKVNNWAIEISPFRIEFQ